jgi:hypothetical protein
MVFVGHPFGRGPGVALQLDQPHHRPRGRGFFTDGYQLGMQIGDLLVGTQWSSAGSSFTSYCGVLTTTNSTAGWNLSTGGTMTSTFRPHVGEDRACSARRAS